MWEHVARAAAADAGRPGAITAIDGLNIVYCQTWQYDDAVVRLADRLGADPQQRCYSGIGGTMGQQLLNATATRMLAGEQDLVLITSAEALATQTRVQEARRARTVLLQARREAALPMGVPAGSRARSRTRCFQAWLTFAIFENARRGHLGTELEPYRNGIAEMMAPMSAVAARNPDAWFRVERSVEDLATVRPDNRMVGYPYTKYMVAVMDIDMAAAVLVATHARADELGIAAGAPRLPPRLVLRHRSSARCRSTRDVAIAGAGRGRVDRTRRGRHRYRRCRVISISTRASAARCTSLATRSTSHLSTGAASTVTGGLPNHGGPGSGYLVHAIAKMTDVLRSDPGAHGVVSGVGMHMTKHVYGVYSTTPGALAPPNEPAVQRALDATPAVPVVAEHDGDATVAAYSVVHGRDGAPEIGGAGVRHGARLGRTRGSRIRTTSGPPSETSWSARRCGSRPTTVVGRRWAPARVNLADSLTRATPGPYVAPLHSAAVTSVTLVGGTRTSGHSGTGGYGDSQDDAAQQRNPLARAHAGAGADRIRLRWRGRR